MHALKLMGGALGGLTLGALMSAFPASGRTESPSDVLVVGLGSEPRSLDPHTTTASSDFRVIVNLYEGLARFGKDNLIPEPGLAETWDVSEDGETYTFRIRPNVRFHDGTLLNAEAVKFNFERMLDSEHPFHDTGPFPLAFFFERIERVEVIDELTVRMRLDEPFAPLLSNLAYPAGLLVSPKAVRERGRELARHPVGTGPFRFQSWESGRRVVLTRHDDYHGEPAKTARLVFRPVSDDMTRVAELRAGGLDLVPELAPDNVTWFRGASGFEVHEVSGPHLWFMILNTRRHPFDDVRVRRAVNYAVDKQALVSHVLQNTAAVAAGPIAQAFGSSAGNVEPYAYDPEKAKALLRQAAIREGTRLTLLAPQSGSGMLSPVAMATAIQADLSAVGFDVEVKTFEWNTFLAEVNDGLDEAHLAEMAWMTNDPDTLPYLALRREAFPPNGFNSGWYSNDRVTELLERARKTTDREERNEMYAKVQRIVHEDAPWLFVASWKQSAVTSERVHGFQLEPSFLLHLQGVAKR